MFDIQGLNAKKLPELETIGQDYSVGFSPFSVVKLLAESLTEGRDWNLQPVLDSALWAVNSCPGPDSLGWVYLGLQR